MLPLRDNIPPRTAAVVNYTIIAICAVVYFFQWADQQDEIVEKYSMIPARVLHPDAEVIMVERLPVELPNGQRAYQERERPAQAPPFTPWLTLLTCTFLHGSWMHVIGNLWFLHIFGDNVEDRFGHFGYLLFYLASGIAASATHLLTNAGSAMPTVGASGAIAGVMGAYLLLYPHARVLTLIPIMVFFPVVTIPAPVFLGIWFLMQFFQGTFALASTQAEGVAWWAHIGGFAFGAAIALVLGKSGLLRERVENILPNTDRLRYYRYR